MPGLHGFCCWVSRKMTDQRNTIDVMHSEKISYLSLNSEAMAAQRALLTALTAYPGKAGYEFLDTPLTHGMPSRS